MAYTVEQLISEFRKDMDDVVDPYLWEDDRIVRWLDEAQKIFAEQVLYWKTFTDITILAADGGYFDLPATMIESRRAKLASQSRPLEVVNFNDVDYKQIYSDYSIDLMGDWRNLTGSPKLLVLDEETGKGRLVGKPEADDTLTLHYFRYPLKDITTSSAKPELTDTRHQLALVIYARSQAYDVHDADVYDPKQRDAKLGEFYAKLDEFAGQEKRKTRRAGVVKYGGL